MSQRSSPSAADWPINRSLHYLALLSTVTIYLQIVLGAYVRHSGAALACPDFPLCQGKLIPQLAGLILIQFAHRLGALLVAGLVIWLARQAHRPGQSPAHRWLSRWALLLVLVQIGLGGLTVLSGLAPLWATGHLAGAAALLAVVLALTLRTRAWRRPASALASSGEALA